MAHMGWDIHGHSWAVKMLQRHIGSGNMRHAYLFSGPDGVGRRTLALRFAQAVNCPESSKYGIACRKCLTCRQIERMQNADLITVKSEEGSSVLKVDQVRHLQHFLSLAPYEGKFRIALLLNFEEANINAQNALLKTIEEPNAKVLLLVIANDPENLLPTITSRCELIRLRPMHVKKLTTILEDEEGLSKDQAELFSHISGGRIGYAKRLAHDAEILEVRERWLTDLLSLLGMKTIARFHYSEKITRGKKNRAEAKQILSDGLTFWLTFWRDVLLICTASGTRITNIDYFDEIQKTAEETGEQITLKIVHTLEHTFKRMQSANLQLMLDNLLLEWPVIQQPLLE